MKKYDNYKDSGIEWIGEIPEHWEIGKIKYSDNVIMGQSPLSDDCNSDGVGLPFLQGNAEFGIKHPTPKLFCDNSNKTAEVNDVLLSVRAPVGALNIANQKVGIGRGLCAVRPLNSNSKYIYYWLLHSFEELNSISTGSTFKAINLDDVKSIRFPIIDVQEQTLIASYLDHKTTQIDTLIAKKEQFITLLQEERTAVINQAVTKGLDPNVKMKDSGIEWLGEIPEHWESWKIGHAFNKVGSGTTPESGNPIYHENGTINWLNTGDLNDGILTECAKKITVKALEDYSSLKLFPPNSLVIAMYGATIGKTAFLEFETTTNQACCVFCQSEIIDLNFLQFWFKAKKEHILNLSIGGGQPNVSQQILKDIRLGCPNLIEQNKIVEFLKVKTKEIDAIISKTREEIELLKEYKTAMISEVVTGKVDVRDLVLN